MLHFEWSKAVKRPSPVVLRARRRGPRSPWTRFVPRLDPMEDRTLLSTWTVMNNYDSGAGSLRAEITAAHNGDTIVFAPKLQGGQTITLASELDITKNLDIEGPGANRLTISGSGGVVLHRVFEIGSGATVTLANLTIANGKTTSTGRSGGALGGGGILNNAGAKLNLTSCSLVNNTAYAGAGLDVFGGGLLNLGTAYVTACTCTGNQVLGGVTGSLPDPFGGSVGGAIDNFGGATLTVTASTFTGNLARGAAGGFFGVGGAIDNNGGFDNDSRSTATISNSIFQSNVATGDMGSLGNGGAINNQGTHANMTLTNSRLIDNQSIGVGANGLGGGIVNQLSGTLIVKNSTFMGNQAKGALVFGGGINNTSSTLTVINSSFFGRPQGPGPSPRRNRRGRRHLEWCPFWPGDPSADQLHDQRQPGHLRLRRRRRGRRPR